MKKLLSFIMLCSLLCLSACTVDKNIQSDVTSSKEPIEMFMFSQMAGFLFLLIKKILNLKGKMFLIYQYFLIAPMQNQ